MSTRDAIRNGYTRISSLLLSTRCAKRFPVRKDKEGEAISGTTSVNQEDVTISFWVSVLVAVVAGLFAAVVAPLVTAGLARRSWRLQKRQELKSEIFKGATAALAAWMTDALDARLQNTKAEWRGMSRQVEMRPETSQALEQYRGLLAAFFSADVAHAFESAIRAKVSLDNIPNTEFEECRQRFVKSAARDLGLC